MVVMTMKMKPTLSVVLLVVVVGILSIVTLASCAPPPSPPNCRFAMQYTVDDLLSNETALADFIDSILYWEGQFHQDGIGYDAQYALTYDGHAIDYLSGEAISPLHTFSAPSKESIHVSLLALALTGNERAMRFIAASSTPGSNATEIALKLLATKMDSYELWNKTYPGYAGFLPWYQLNETGIYPVDGWQNKVPALDNGELVWALRAAALALNNIGEVELGNRYLNYFYQMANNSLMVFYEGAGLIRSVTYIIDMFTTPTPDNYKSDGAGYLDDPYEGELFAFLMDMYGTWANESERDLIWIVKNALLQPVVYNINSTTSITCQEGWWFSSHEQWKYMELPYTDIPINNRVFLNGERARTWNSALKNYPGLFASVNDVSSNNSIPDYLSASGIEEIAFQPSTNRVVTPYASFPVWLAAGDAIGAAWYLTMLQGPRMQGPYGSTEGINTIGTEISPVVTWDSKITTVLAMAGGITNLTRTALQMDGKYDRFYSVVDTVWTAKFPSLNGEELPFALPTATIPMVSPTDFPTCTA
eukprot:TRINITY_DN11510_c0_g1_i1.p1 TRINITY_DN11510_c0_g1~~TRINITY_DN11510_c0_g1_i1.p1  ORF type:complete len:553 (+),score=122.93 TRINITY_DN11510_c0_g1_i1:63-1661(+)